MEDLPAEDLPAPDLPAPDLPSPASTPPAAGDPDRLAVLDAYGILDTPPEVGFDDIVRLATRLCATPVALISLVARDRQWFKAKTGFPACETDLDRSVCRFALDEPDLLVIPDLTLDPRTANNPLVTADPRIRFYAGAPLRAPSGHVLGSLCVIDTVPRPGGLTPDQADDLRALGRQVTDLLALRRSLAARDALLGDQEAVRHGRETFGGTQAAVAAAGGDLDTILDLLVAGAMRAVPAAEGGVIELVEGEELVYRATRGTLAPHRGLRVPLHDSLAGRCALDDAALLANDVVRERQVKPHLAARLGMRAAVLAPFSRNGRVIGVLKLQSSRADAFTERDLDLARLFAGAATSGLTAADEATAQRALRVGEERLTFAFEASGSLGWWDWDLADDRVYAGERFARMYGVDPMAAAAGTPIAAYLDGIHPDDRERAGRSIQVAIETAGELAEEYRLRAPDGTVSWVYARGRCTHDETGRPLRFPGVALDITARKAAEIRQAALVELGDRLRETDDPARMAYAAAEIMGRTLAATRAGYGTVDVRRETVVIEPDWRQDGTASVSGPHRFRDYGSFIDDLARGELVVVADARTDPRTAAMTDALVAIGIRALVNVPIIEHGALVAMLFVHHDRPRVWSHEDVALVRSVADRTRAGIARVRAEAQQRVLNGELSHRLKNTLAMVQSIATQTLRAVPDKAPVEAFERRIHALAAAHDVLVHQDWNAAPMGAVADAVLGNFGQAGQLAVSGPEVSLGPRAALSLSLLLHELGTNALKYGALSNEAGRVDVCWRLEGANGAADVVLDWREAGGPPVREPDRRGFGSRLIRMGLVGAGGVELRYPVSGFQAEMRAPLVQMQQS